MCGLAGIFRTEGSLVAGFDPRQVIRDMTGTLVHRGPDAEGFFEDPRGRCYLGHRRLSIVDLSDAGRQPMASESGRWMLAFNGEIYNFEEIRERLRTEGASFRGHSDTEVLASLIERRGTAAFPELDGMFGMAAFDTASGELLLARDPFGEKPLYFARVPGAIVFASELRALEVVPGFDKTVSLAALAEVLALYGIGAPRTIYAAASKVEPGTWQRLTPLGGVTQTYRYFSFEPGAQPFRREDPEQLADELEELLVRSLRRRLVADVPLGAFLSGGVDSSLTVALAVRRLGVPMRTFSMGFEGAAESEHDAAREFARHLGTEHHEEILTPDVSAFLERSGELLDEPNGDSSCLPTYMLSETTRRHVTVALSGDGGDELFGGYTRYQGADPARYYSRSIRLMGDRQLADLMGCVPPPLVFRLEELHRSVVEGSRPVLCRLRQTDVENYLPNAVLAKVDRMSMLHSLEVRTPFLSAELAGFAAALAPSVLLNGDQGKWLLRHVAYRHLPRAMIDAPKRGFGLPMSGWARDRLVASLTGTLQSSDSPLAQSFGRRATDAFLAQQLHSFGAYQSWALCMLDHWLRSHRAVVPPCLAPAPKAPARSRSRFRRARHAVRDAVRSAIGRISGRDPNKVIRRSMRALLAAPPPAVGASDRASGPLALYTHALVTGGAERQWCLLAVALKELGERVVLVVNTHTSHFYESILAKHSIAILIAGEHVDNVNASRVEMLALQSKIKSSGLPYGQECARLAMTLRAIRPRALISQLDSPNVTAGMAGCLEGVPRVILSFRNYNPDNFVFGKPWFKPMYQVLTQQAPVRLMGNARNCNCDYADWIGVPRHQVHLLPNIVDPSIGPAGCGNAERGAVEPPGASDLTLLGVFRFAEEKCPELFLDVADRVRQQVPGVRVLLAGEGRMADTVSTQISDRRLGDVVTLLGGRSDVPSLMRNASVLLHTARFEGTPNVILEAQAIGLPVVCTDTGAASECVMHGETGFVCPVGDAQSLAHRCIELLQDAQLRRSFSCRAPAAVSRRHAPAAVARRLLELIDAA